MNSFLPCRFSPTFNPAQPGLSPCGVNGNQSNSFLRYPDIGKALHMESDFSNSALFDTHKVSNKRICLFQSGEAALHAEFDLFQILHSDYTSADAKII